ISPDFLIRTIAEEYERRQATIKRAGTAAGGADEAHAVTPGSSGRGSNGRGRGRGKSTPRKPFDLSKVECWNCKKFGHMKKDCPQPPKSETGAANAAVESDSDFDIDKLDAPPAVAAAVTDARGAETDRGARTELYDSGTTSHISPYREDFENLEEILPREFRAANSAKFAAKAKGELVINVPNGVSSSALRLTEVLYAPEVGYTLVSIGQLDKLGFKTEFGDGKCRITAPDGQTVGEVLRTQKGLYRVDRDADTANAAVESVTAQEMHRLLGHCSPEVAQRMLTSGMATGLRLEFRDDKPFFCDACTYAKATTKKISRVRQTERATAFGEKIHADVWGPAPTQSLGGNRYFVTFTDDSTRYLKLYLLKAKSDTFRAYTHFEAWCKTQHKASIGTLQSDRGGEFTSAEFSAHLKAAGTERRLTVHDTPQHNGVAERRNRTLLEKIRAMRFDSKLPQNIWGEAMMHAAYLINIQPTSALGGKSPYHALHNKPADVSELLPFGAPVWVHTGKGSKLGEGRVIKGRFVGVADDTADGFRIYWQDKKSVTTERNVYEREQDAREAAARFEGEQGWDKDDPPAASQATHPVAEPSRDEKKENGRGDPPAATRTPTQNAPRWQTRATPPTELIDVEAGRPTRERKASRRVQEILDGLGMTSARPSDPRLEYAFAAEMSDADALEPRTLSEAQRRPDWTLWEQAIREELATLDAMGTWELVDAPAGANVVGSKWVFRAKKDATGSVVRHKARLVAQGFSQVPGVDYFDTFAPVAKLASIRIVLAMAARLDLELHQIDIKGAYLNGQLTDDEVVYMRQPPGFEAPGTAGKVCRLLKTLYGLKQSGRRWYQRLVEILCGKLAFTRSEVDQAVFFKVVRGGQLVIVVVHVDDCTIAASTVQLVREFKNDVRKHVEITDLGELHWLLGIEVRRDRDAKTLALSQKSYIESILRRYNLEDVKPVSIPMDPNTRLSSADAPSSASEYALMRDKPYAEAVGSLMYAMLGTRPDISYAVTTLGRFSRNPGLPHWNAVLRVFKYLKGTRDAWLTYGTTSNELHGFGDADGSMADDRRAISGFALILDGGAVSWSSKSQEIVSLSTTESEYVAATHAAKEVLWARSLLAEVFEPVAGPTTLYSDNQSAIALAQDNKYHARTKHIDVRYHFIRWIIEEGKITLVYCPTDDMIADALTKALPSAKVKHFASALGL
ncbi:hypothetical protein EXIGLDRAFT_569675, partial [Exidia glandulosa HHB12029]